MSAGTRDHVRNVASDNGYQRDGDIDGGPLRVGRGRSKNGPVTVRKRETTDMAMNLTVVLDVH